MNRIDFMFKNLKLNNKKGFFPFAVAGYPNLDTTEKLIIDFEKLGADLVEIGVPFSDPIADGPVIQNASYKALLKGINLEKIFLLVERLRRKVSIPIVLMSYYNPILKMGLAKVAQRAKAVGVDGFIIPDLPVEASLEFKRDLKSNNIKLIYLISINSMKDRIKLVSKNSSGFIYLVSKLGVTGVSKLNMDPIERMVKQIREYTKTPIAVGFGISSKEQATEILKSADAIIMASALVDILAKEKFEPALKKIRTKILSIIKNRNEKVEMGN